MQVNSPNPTSFYPLNTEPPSGFGFRPNFPPTLQNFYLPFNPAYVELPEAKAEDLTPRSGWISKLNDVEKKYLEERNENSELEEKIQHLRLQMSAMDNASTANLEQLAGHITSLEQEINIHKTREEDLQGQIKARDEFINKVKETVQENEENYRKHLDVVKREFEKLEDNNKEFKERIAALTIENQSLRLEAAEAKNETAKIQGIRDTEKLLIQNQLKETQTELTKLNNKYYELTKDLERTKYMLEDVSGKSSKAERELIYKETEIKRLSEITNVANEKLRSEDRDFEKTLNERVMTMTLKSREEKLDYETKYKLEQKASFELKTQLEQLSKTTQSLRQDNYELKCTNKSNEERIMKLELLEQETALKFSSLKEKYDAHFTKRDEETFNKEVKLVKCREEVESLKIEKEHHERLIFQYQNFLKLYNLDYEFNSLTRLDKGPFNKTTVEMKHEAREKAAREYYRENEAKRYNDIVREKYRLLDEGTEEKTETLRKEMDNIANDMEDEWKKLFTNLSEFKSKINP